MKVAPRDVLRAMVRAVYGRTIEDTHLAAHQVTAVSRLVAMLETRRGAILADEVGLGKSFVAAAVAREMTRRGLDVELVVPASLTAQWRETLQRFDLAIPMLTHDSLARRDAVPGVGRERLIVVDEAHRFRNPATKRYQSLALRSVAHRVLLVTATPICNSLSDLESLVRLIAADDALALEGVDSLERAFETGDRRALEIVLDELIVRRGRDALPESLSFGKLERTVVRYPVHAAGAIADAIETLQFPLIAGEGDRALLRGIVWRRLESSDAALAATLRRQSRFYRRARESLRDGFVMTKRDYLEIFGDDDGEPIQELLFPDCWLTPSEIPPSIVVQVDAEIDRIDALRELLAREDRKLDALNAFLKAIDGPALLFTSSIATAFHLYRSLDTGSTVGVISSRRCAMHGERARSRDDVLDAFRRGELSILISTDLGAEGLNLQRARNVIHYDLPWNPVKLDQRNGRAWRIGQKQPRVSATYFIPEERSSRVVLSAIAAKNRRRRSLLVDRGAIIDDALAKGESLLLDGVAPRAIDEHAICLVAVSNRLMILATDDSRWLSHVDSLDATGPAELLTLDDSSLVKRIASRASLVPRMRANHPNVQFLSRIAGPDRELLDRLSRRYRAGVEILLRQMSTEFLDRDKIEYVREILRRESFGTTEPGTRIVAAIPISAAPEREEPLFDCRRSTRRRRRSRAVKEAR